MLRVCAGHHRLAAVGNARVARLVLAAGSAGWMLISRLCEARLFAIGATVVLFAAEREEGTRTLLQLLPQNRPAVLVGKLMAVVVMSLAVLAFSGCWFVVHWQMGRGV